MQHDSCKQLLRQLCVVPHELTHGWLPHNVSAAAKHYLSEKASLVQKERNESWAARGDEESIGLYITDLTRRKWLEAERSSVHHTDITVRIAY